MAADDIVQAVKTALNARDETVLRVPVADAVGRVIGKGTPTIVGPVRKVVGDSIAATGKNDLGAVVLRTVSAAVADSKGLGKAVIDRVKGAVGEPALSQPILDLVGSSLTGNSLGQKVVDRVAAALGDDEDLEDEGLQEAILDLVGGGLADDLGEKVTNHVRVAVGDDEDFQGAIVEVVADDVADGKSSTLAGPILDLVGNALGGDLFTLLLSKLTAATYPRLPAPGTPGGPPATDPEQVWQKALDDFVVSAAVPVTVKILGLLTDIINGMLANVPVTAPGVDPSVVAACDNLVKAIADLVPVRAANAAPGPQSKIVETMGGLLADPAAPNPLRANLDTRISRASARQGIIDPVGASWVDR